MQPTPESEVPSRQSQATAPRHQVFHSQDQIITNEQVSECTKRHPRDSELIFQYPNIEKQSEVPVTVKCTELQRGSDYGVLSLSGYNEVNTPSMVTQKAHARGREIQSEQTFAYEVESPNAHHIQASQSISQFPDQELNDMVGSAKRKAESERNLEQQLSHERASHWTGQSLVEEYVDHLVRRVNEKGRQKELQQESSDQELPLQQNSQPNQVSSIGRNSDELSEDSKEQITSGEYLKKDRHSQSEDSQQLTRSAFEQPNFVQQCTDPSDDKDGKVNQDSQQSSAVSQYFRQSETDELPQEDLLLGPPVDSISRQVICEAEEYQYEQFEEQKQAQLLDQLAIQSPVQIAERDQHEECDSNAEQNQCQKQEFSISEEHEDEQPNVLPALPSQTDPEGLDYSASGIDGAHSFMEKSCKQINSGRLSAELAANENTPKFEMKNPQSSHHASHEQSLTKLKDSPATKKSPLSSKHGGGHAEAGHTPVKSPPAEGEAKLEPSSIDYSNQFDSVEVRGTDRAPKEPPRVPGQAVGGRTPLSFDRLEAESRKEVRNERYIRDDQSLKEAPPVVEGHVRTSQDLDMFDLSRGQDESAQRESRATKVTKNRRTGQQSRVSSRFSQEAQEELEKVAERINQSVDLNANRSSLEQDGDLIPETKEEYMKSKNTLKSYSSERSIKRGSVDLQASIHAEDLKSRSKVKSHSRTGSQQKVLLQEIASQKEGHLKVVVHKGETQLRKPPEVPSLVVAARERAEQLKKPKMQSLQDQNQKGKSGLVDSGFNMPIESGSYPVKLNKRSVIKSPVLTSAAQRRNRLNFQFINKKKKEEGEQVLSTKRGEEHQSSTSRRPTEHLKSKIRHNPSLSPQRNQKKTKSAEKETKLSAKKEERPRGVRRTVFHQAMKKNAPANRNSESDREGSHPPLGSRLVKTANTTGTREVRNNVTKSMDRSSSPASGNHPRRPLSTDQTITLSNHDYPTKQPLILSNKLQSQNRAGDHVSSKINLSYSGLTKEELQGLSVDEIYSRMAKNLVRHHQNFEQRCHEVANSEPQALEAPIDLTAPKAKFQILKAKLLESTSIGERKLSDLSMPQNQAKPTVFIASNNHLSQPLHNESLLSDIPDFEELSQKKEPPKLEKGQFILYTTQPIKGMQTQASMNLAQSPAATTQYSSGNQARVFAFSRPDKPASSYLSRPFRQQLTPNSGTSFDSIFQAQKFKQNGHLNYHQTKSLVNVQSLLPSNSYASNQSRAGHRFVSTGRQWMQNDQSAVYRADPNPKKGRASTANNYKSRGLATNLKPEKIMSSNAISSQNHDGDQPSGNSRFDQQRLQNKLQYRSMRGRKIQEFLAQVKSQKLEQNKGGLVDIKILSACDSQSKAVGEYQYGSGITVGGDVHGSGVPRQFKRTSFGDKSQKGHISSVDGSLNQIDSNPDLNDNHRNPVRVNARKVSSGFKDTMNSTISSQLAKENFNDSVVLSQFLAQQDKRIDFGASRLFQKVQGGESLDLFANEDPKENPLSSDEIEGLISLVRRKSSEKVQTAGFRVKSHDKIMDTLAVLMHEMGLGCRLGRMQRRDEDKTLDRIYVLACRAHKLYKAREQLIQIFSQIGELRQEMADVKKDLRGRAESQREPMTYDETQDITLRAATLKMNISLLVYNVQTLLGQFKFFNQSFVLDDKDYLKYLSKETNELKGLFNQLDIPFE